MLLRETLKEIKDVSFLVDDDEVLDEALERLNVLKLLLKKSILTESNILLEQQEVSVMNTNQNLKDRGI